MELTPKEQKRLRRLERAARQDRFVVYPLAAVFLVSLGVTGHAVLTGREQCVVQLFILISGYPMVGLVMSVQRQQLFRIVKKLQGSNQPRTG